MDKSELYDEIAKRKSKPEHYFPYKGGNGRIDRCVALMKSGKIKTGGELLDIGGSIGDLGYAVSDLYSHRTTFDISSLVLEAAEAKGNDVVRGDVDKTGLMMFLDEKIDVITALDFIEHIIDPGKLARECFRILKSGGQVFINTPNIQYWPHIKQLILGKFPHTSGDKEVYHGGHLSFFTHLDLCEIFSEAGFTKFEQFKDEEGYDGQAINDAERAGVLKAASQKEYIEQCMRFGNPNLLFLANKP